MPAYRRRAPKQRARYPAICRAYIRPTQRHARRTGHTDFVKRLAHGKGTGVCVFVCVCVCARGQFLARVCMQKLRLALSHADLGDPKHVPQAYALTPLCMSEPDGRFCCLVLSQTCKAGQ